MGAIWVAVIAGLFPLLTFSLRAWLDHRSSNIAILSEVQRLLNVLESHRKFWEKCVSSGDIEIPLIPFFTPVFDEQVKSIGKIDSRVAAKVAAFYGYVKFINSVQSRRSEYPPDENEKRFNEHYLGMLATVIGSYTGQFDEHFRKYGLLK